MLGASVRGRVRLRMGLANWQLVLGEARSKGMSLARGGGGAKNYRRGAAAQQILHYLYMACMVYCQRHSRLVVWCLWYSGDAVIPHVGGWGPSIEYGAERCSLC